MSQTKTKEPLPFLFNRAEGFEEKNGTISITALSNVASYMKHPERYTLVPSIRFLGWNKQQKKEWAWWVEPAVFAKFKKILDLFGYEFSEFQVAIPEKMHPILFINDKMCFIICPYASFNEKYNALSVADRSRAVALLTIVNSHSTVKFTPGKDLVSCVERQDKGDKE